MPDNRKPLHKQPKVCAHILKSVESSSVSLKIAASSIENAGSGLFVVNDVAAGAEIFRSQPLLMVCEGNHAGICDYCFRNQNSPLRPDGRFYHAGDKHQVVLAACVRCKNVEYCSKECQAKAWKSYHKYECSIVKEIIETNKNMGSLPQALARVLLWIKKQTIMEENFDAIVSMVNHYDERSDRWLDIFEKDEDAILEPTLQTAYQVKQSTNSKLGLGQVQKLFLAIYHNAGAICPPEIIDQYGSFLDLAVSTINHSCNNNAHVYFNGRELRCRALKNIPAGTEITLHYYPTPRHDVLLRRNSLDEYMYIKCNCERCRKEITEHLAEAPSRKDHLSRVREAQLKLDKLGLDAQKAFNSSRTLKSCISFQEQINAIALKGYPAGRWPEHMEPLPHIYRILGGMYRDLRYAVGLEFMLKGTLYVADRTDPNWVADLLELVKFMFFMAQAGDDDVNWLAAEDKSLMERADMRHVAAGYLLILCGRAKFAFGMDANLVQALYNWTGETLGFIGDLEVLIKSFGEDFEKSQRTMLNWANANLERALSLPSPEEIVQLQKDLERLGSSAKLGDAIDTMSLGAETEHSARPKDSSFESGGAPSGGVASSSPAKSQDENAKPGSAPEAVKAIPASIGDEDVQSRLLRGSDASGKEGPLHLRENAH